MPFVNACFSRFLVGVCYCPPNGQTFVLSLYVVLSEVCIRFPNHKMFIFGDINFLTLDWSLPGSPHKEENSFVYLCFDLNLSQAVREPSVIISSPSNILDLMLVSDTARVVRILFLESLSDHWLLHTTLSL